MPPRTSPRKKATAAVGKTKEEANGAAKKPVAKAKTKTKADASAPAKKKAAPSKKRKKVEDNEDEEEHECDSHGDATEEEGEEEEKKPSPKKRKTKKVKEEEEEEEEKGKPSPKKRKTKKEKEDEMAPLAARTAVTSLKKAMYIGAHVSAAGGAHHHHRCLSPTLLCLTHESRRTKLDSELSACRRQRPRSLPQIATKMDLPASGPHLAGRLPRRRQG